MCEEIPKELKYNLHFYIIYINIKINIPLFYIMPKRHFSKTRRRYKRKGGGEDYDIEQGPVMPIVPIKRIPTDPIRKQEELGRNLTSVISPDQAELVFSGPNPEERQRLERSEMGMYDKEDPDVTAYTSSDMKLFSEGGKRRRTKRHRRKTRKTRRVGRKTRRRVKR